MGRGKNEGAEEYWERYNELAGRDTKDLAVAVKAGITTSTLSSWKNGGRFPPVHVAHQIADYFGVSVEYMVTGRKDKHSFEESKLLELAKKHQKILINLEDMDMYTLNTVEVQIKAVAESCRQTKEKKNG